jgi:starvation-inducible DNA-binding protein
MDNLVQGLSHLLANTYVLYTKTQNFHWHVKGEDFYPYHKMFEEQYQSLAEAIDTLAERIRALQCKAPASLQEFLQLTSLKESQGDKKTEQMVADLLFDHETIIKSFSNLFQLAQSAGDEVTLDLFIQRMAEHQKIAWMLRSSLGK